MKTPMTTFRGAQAGRLRPYPKYKDSDVDWLDQIPEQWSVGRLKTTVTACQNGLWGEEPDGLNDVACVRVADFDRVSLQVRLSDPTLRSLNIRDRQARQLKAGDLLLEKSGGGEKQPVGAVVIYDGSESAVCSNFIARMPVAEGFVPRFLAYLHSAAYTARIITRSIKQSTGIQNLDSSAYLSERVPIPTIGEQQAIAEFLDRETTKIDALIAKKERLIRLLQEKQTALISQVVTTGLEPNIPRKDSEVEWLGEIPQHWTVRPLSQLLVRITYGFTNPMPITEEGPNLLTANDIGDGEIHWERARRTASEAFKMTLTAKSKPVKDDILVTKDGTLGRVAVSDGRVACINQSVALLRINTRMASVDFVQNSLRAIPYHQRMLFEAGGTTIKHIYISRLARMPLALPPKEEQARICEFISGHRKDLDGLILKVRTALLRLKEYRSALVFSAVTGAMDVREESR